MRLRVALFEGENLFCLLCLCLGLGLVERRWWGGRVCFVCGCHGLVVSFGLLCMAVVDVMGVGFIYGLWCCYRIICGGS